VDNFSEMWMLDCALKVKIGGPSGPGAVRHPEVSEGLEASDVGDVRSLTGVVRGREYICCSVSFSSLEAE
jgi:hypothetical protein